MSLADNLWRFKLSLQLAYLAFAACLVSFIFYTLERDSLQDANAQRFVSLELTQELHQSSDDLTRMARTFVVTGERRYRDYFEEIAAIRDGLSPRPLEYNNSYWDFVLSDPRPTAMGPAQALLQRMVDAEFTQEELGRLADAKTVSDHLTNIEEMAMTLVETKGSVSEESWQNNQREAQRMLYDASYLRAKADIMRPIVEVTRMVNERTTGKIATSEKRISQLFWINLVSGAVLVSMLWMIQRNLRLVLGGSVSQLSKIAFNIASDGVAGESSADIRDPDSIIGKFMEVKQLNASIEGQRRNSERALSEAERRFLSFASELREGVCVVQDSLICFVNPKLLEMLKYQEKNLLNKPFIQFAYSDDREAMMARYRKRIENIDVQSNTQFRLNTGTGGVLKVTARASVFEWAGRPATLYFVNIAEN